MKNMKYISSTIIIIFAFFATLFGSSFAQPKSTSFCESLQNTNWKPNVEVAGLQSLSIQTVEQNGNVYNLTGSITVNGTPYQFQTQGTCILLTQNPSTYLLSFPTQELCVFSDPISSTGEPLTSFQGTVNPTDKSSTTIICDQNQKLGVITFTPG